ncbi:FAD dependent oxidoreductase [Umbelopsis sp. PMI_123]|nr:FAD dependent oxidoreductase [Umbelopsis sp. PMI_123]
MPSNHKHVIIIGAGAVGASVSYFLSKKDPNLKITVVEKTGVAQAASGKSGGFLALDWSASTELGPLSSKSFQLHEQLAKELDGESYGYRKVDTYAVTMASTTSGKRFKTISWLDTVKIDRVEQMGNKKTTAQVHPYLFTNKLVDDAKRRGVEVLCGQGVKSLVWDHSKNKLTGVMLDDDTVIEGDAAVVCMGPWSSTLPIRSNRSPRGKLPIIAARAHSIVLKPHCEVPAQALFCSVQLNRNFYDPEIYPRPDSTVYICGETDDETLPPSAADVQIKQKSIDTLRELAAIVSPSHLGDAELVATQACYLPTSKDGLPLIGEHPNSHGVYIATGHSCWGILNSPVTGLMLSELLVDGKITCVDPATAAAVSPKGRC